MTKNEQKVLDFMLENPRLDYLASEIQKGTRVSRAGANLALRSLAKQKFIKRRKRGKTYFYAVNFEDAAIKEFKRLKNINQLKPLVKQLSKYVLKIILFGSAARGENVKGSDYDLFILTRVPENVRQIISKKPFKDKLQVVIKTPVDFVKFEKQNPIFNQEINKGIVLWQQP